MDTKVKSLMLSHGYQGKKFDVAFLCKVLNEDQIT